MIDLCADGFEYSEEEEQDDGAVDIENQYYNAKGARRGRGASESPTIRPAGEAHAHHHAHDFPPVSSRAWEAPRRSCVRACHSALHAWEGLLSTHAMGRKNECALCPMRDRMQGQR